MNKVFALRFYNSSIISRSDYYKIIFFNINKMLNTVDFTNLFELTNLKDPRYDQSAVTRKYYESNIKSKNSFIDVTTSSGVVTLESKPRKFKQLADCAPMKDATEGLVPVYNASNNTWKPSSEPFKVFHPGDTVAAGKASDTQKYGFYYDAGLLIFKTTN